MNISFRGKYTCIIIIIIHCCVQIVTIEVKEKPDDVAYSDIALPYHVDASGWKESPPGLTVLHCTQSVD